MSDFKHFGKAVNEQLAKMSNFELFTTDVTGDELIALYLASFPEGTDPIYKTNTEHTCTCCFQFIRNMGNLVMVNEAGEMVSLWNVYGKLEAPYDVVARALFERVRAAKINGIFRTDMASFGQEATRKLQADGKTVVTHNHFYGTTPARMVIKTRKVGGETVSADSVKGAYASGVQVFERGLKELTRSAVTDVLGLIERNDIYRGAEHLHAVKAFNDMQLAYGKAKNKNAFVWANSTSPAVSRFRNTAIGKLVQDLSEGTDLEAAVKSFEAMVAPTNYKRTTSLITPKMIEQAQATLAELGLENAIHRRLAKLSDVSVNNVLWVDNSARAQMKDGIAGLLADQVGKTTTKADAAVAQAIGIDKFMSDVLPKASSIDVMLKNQHMGNFVSVTTSDDPAKLFQWDNPFGWSYDGNVTDSIKERVAKAGGNVTNAKLRISLSWFNHDDLDIHVVQPDGDRIYHGSRRSPFGHLDVDMNISPESRQAVENISWTRVQDGPYRVMVNNYTKRESIDVGCVIEIECDGQIIQLSHPGVLKKSHSWGEAGSQIAMVHVRNGRIEKIDPATGVVGGGYSQEKWGVKTEDFVKVKTVMYSPNYWDANASGNKHWFFLLDGCKNDMPARGIYNEFLRSDLAKHRKVFEILGDKTKCDPTDDQLSGVGFSSTRKDELTVRVKSGKITKLYNINFSTKE